VKIALKKSLIFCAVHPDIIRMIKSRRMRWAGHVVRMGVMRNSYILVGKSEVRRLLGRTRNRWENTARENLKEIGPEGTKWTQLA
jgi:hypothetical protein